MQNSKAAGILAAFLLSADADWHAKMLSDRRTAPTPDRIPENHKTSDIGLRRVLCGPMFQSVAFRLENCFGASAITDFGEVFPNSRR